MRGFAFCRNNNAFIFNPKINFSPPFENCSKLLKNSSNPSTT